MYARSRRHGWYRKFRRSRSGTQLVVVVVTLLVILGFADGLLVRVCSGGKPFALFPAFHIFEAMFFGLLCVLWFRRQLAAERRVTHLRITWLDGNRPTLGWRQSVRGSPHRP
jgi:hypothetical protein